MRTALHRRTSVRLTGVALAGALIAATLAGTATARPADTATTTTPAGGSVHEYPQNYAINAFEVRDGINDRSYKENTRAVKRAVRAEGGEILRSYPKIGVVIAQAQDASFAEALRSAEYADVVESLGATRTSATTMPDREVDPHGMFQQPEIEPEPLEDDQWGNEALDSLAANEIQPGSEDVIVAVLDSGVESTHEDLAESVDTSLGADCTNNGILDTSEGAGEPTTSFHGTHVGGTIGAQRNGVGIAGIAPGVTLASVKVVNADGFIFPEVAICGFMHATKIDADITNSSYYIDPWLYWCPDDAEQGPVLEAVTRAIEWTHKKGAVNVASAGNADTDLANKTTDSSSPNDTTPIPNRPVDGCFDMPTELPGVVTVAATEEDGDKSSFSNYGDGVIDVTAPGTNVLSTCWSGAGAGDYCYASGTSMSSPHVAGVAALALSQYPDLTKRELRRHLEDTATDVPCPAGDSECTGSDEYNGYFGHGLVNALNAVTQGGES